MPTTVTGVAQTTLTDQDLAAKILSEHKCAASSITQAILETADDSLNTWGGDPKPPEDDLLHK